MVAGVIVNVRHGRVEDNAPEQLEAIINGFLRPAPELISKQRIRPAVAVEIVFVAVEHSESADESKAKIAALSY